MFSYFFGLDKILYGLNFLQKNITKKWLRYPENFIDKCFKFLDTIYLVKENVPIAEEKRFFVVLPHLGVISLQSYRKQTRNYF